MLYVLLSSLYSNMKTHLRGLLSGKTCQLPSRVNLCFVFVDKPDPPEDTEILKNQNLGRLIWCLE